MEKLENTEIKNPENLSVQKFLEKHETRLKKLGLKSWVNAIQKEDINIYIKDCVEIGRNGLNNNRVLEKSEEVCDSSKSLFKKLLELLGEDGVMPIILDLLQVEGFEFNGVRSLGSLALKKKDWYPKDEEINDLLTLIEKIKAQVQKEKKEYEENKENKGKEIMYYERNLEKTKKFINYFDNSIINLIWEYINPENEQEKLEQEEFETELKKEIKEKKAKSIKEQMKLVGRKASDITADRGFFGGV